LLGIVTSDDVLRLAEKENTREIQRIGGSEALEEPYTTISFGHLVKKRAGWLVILFLGEMLTATAMAFFEGEISKAVVLALFIPLIISSGGNSGSQASSLLYVRWPWEEIPGLVLCDAERNFSGHRVQFWRGWFFPIFSGSISFYNYGEHWMLVGFTVVFPRWGCFRELFQVPCYPYC
jgi:magnesium transporter